MLQTVSTTGNHNVWIVQATLKKLDIVSLLSPSLASSIWQDITSPDIRLDKILQVLHEKSNMSCQKIALTLLPLYGGDHTCNVCTTTPASAYQGKCRFTFRLQLRVGALEGINMADKEQAKKTGPRQRIQRVLKMAARSALLVERSRTASHFNQISVRLLVWPNEKVYMLIWQNVHVV